jgi:hypothetical protein
MEDVMADDEAEIRGPTERWVRAVHTGDMSGVLADHSDRMFDLPVCGRTRHRHIPRNVARVLQNGKHRAPLSN